MVRNPPEKMSPFSILRKPVGIELMAIASIVALFWSLSPLPVSDGSAGTQCYKADGTSKLTISVSHFRPNGGADMGTVPELAYYVLSGSIMVKGRAEETILNAGDLIHFAAGEERSIKVNGQVPASLPVVIVAPG